MMAASKYPSWDWCKREQRDNHDSKWTTGSPNTVVLRLDDDDSVGISFSRGDDQQVGAR